MENNELVASDLIRLVQLPVIEEQLRGVQDSVKLRVRQATSLSCSPETVVEVKKVRSELNKELQRLEEVRKQVKSEVLRPYNNFESTYKECVSSEYRSGIELLDAKIQDVESAIKATCKERLVNYFRELTELEGLKWLTFERTGVVVDLTSAKQKTPKKLMEQIKNFVNGVAMDIKAISQMPECDEILVEYRTCLSLQQAICIVKERHKLVEQQKAERESKEPILQDQEKAVSEVSRYEVKEVSEEPTVAPVLENDVVRCPFTVITTKEKLKKLKNFLIQEGIRYE